MNRSPRTRLAVWTAAGVLGAGLAAGGVAQAVSSPTPSSPPAAGKTTHDGKDKGRHHGRDHGALGRLGGSLVHGDVVVRTKTGYATMALQRGTVQAVTATSMQVRSADGFTASYALTADTRVHKGRALSQPSDLAKGDVVIVRATRSGTTLTAATVSAHTAKTGSPATE